jgi:hypothetical protein
MRSEQLLLDKYNTDKISCRLLEEYDQVLEPWVNENIKLLELGIQGGGSHLLWRDYFPKGTIVGIDIIVPPNFATEERIHFFEGSQTDTRVLSEVAGKMAPEGFDIIIDDASHIGEYTKQSFWHLFNNHLKPGGLYVIEDWRTGYQDILIDGTKSPDGKSLKSKEGFLSKLRSGLQPHGTMSFSGKAVKTKGGLQSILRSESRPRFNTLIYVLFAILLKTFPSLLSGTGGKAGLPPLFHHLLKIPFETHRYGMVGFVKQLVDEQASLVISKFSKMMITKNLIFVHKAVHQS